MAQLMLISRRYDPTGAHLRFCGGWWVERSNEPWTVMIIVWRGLGILVLVIFGAVMAITEMSVNAMTNNPGYFEVHVWPKLVCSSIAAGLIFLISMMRSRPG